MVQIIAGEKGKGKTKILLDKVNADIVTSKGTIVYLDKSNKHMYELNNKIRLINVNDYCVECASEFVGFICGIISQDHDLEQMYIDGFLRIVRFEGEDLTRSIRKLQSISKDSGVDIFVSISIDADDVPEEFKDCIEVAL